MILNYLRNAPHTDLSDSGHSRSGDGLQRGTPGTLHRPRQPVGRIRQREKPDCEGWSSLTKRDRFSDTATGNHAYLGAYAPLFGR